MSEPTKNFYSYCLQSPADVEGALVKLAQARQGIERVNKGNLERFYFYANSILEKLKQATGEKKTMTGNMMKFLDKELIADFINQPNDAFKQVDLSRQLVIVASGLGVSAGADPYDQEDLAAMVNGTFKFYHDVPFAYTLSQIINSGVDASAMAEVSLGFLRFEGEAADQGAVEMKWEAAFLLALTLQAAWIHFNALSEESRKLLLRDYVYLSIVGGVPVRSALRDFVYSTGQKSAERAKFVFNGLVSLNREEVPLRTDFSQWKKMSDVVRNYTARLGGELSGGFGQEEFLQGFYQGQPNRDFFRGWLREILNIVSDLNV